VAFPVLATFFSFLSNMSKNWFITGVSTGFGAALADLALAQGDKVAATFRKQEQADEFSQKAGLNGRFRS
jgi:NAD(P)-dependent dehydrogenase (short-subunit alcohol dehydrogenase family)